MHKRFCKNIVMKMYQLRVFLHPVNLVCALKYKLVTKIISIMNWKHFIPVSIHYFLGVFALLFLGTFWFMNNPG